MADTTFSIDIDVSRAITAQQKIIDKMDDFGKASKRAGEAFEPMRSNIDNLNTSISNISKSSLTRMQEQINRIREAMKAISDMPEVSFFKVNRSDHNNLLEAEAALKRMVQAAGSVVSSMRDMPGFKFDVYSVNQYRDKIKELNNSLSELQYLKPRMNSVDFSNFEKSYKDAIANYQTSLSEMVNGTKTNIAENIARLRSIPKDMDLILQRTQNSFSSGMNKLMDFDPTIRAAKEAAAQIRKTFVDLGSYSMMGYAGARTPSSSTIQAGLNNISNTNIAGVSRELNNAANASEAVGTKLGGLGLVIKRVFEYGMVYRFQNAVLSLPGAIFKANEQMEMLSATFKGAFGDDAVSSLNYVKEAANRYGLELISLGESYKKFAVTMDQLDVDGKTTNMIFESTTEALKKAGASSGDTANAFRALIQMYSKGTVSAEEFTRQLSQYIPAANSLAAKSIGITTAEFKKFLTTGQLIPDEFIPSFAKQMKIFGMGWEEAADTMTSNVQRMHNAWLEMVNSKAFQEAAGATIKTATGLMQGLGDVFSGGRLAARGDIPFLTWLLGSPEELNKAIKDYDSKMSTLDGKIAALKEKYEKSGHLSGRANSKIIYDASVGEELASAEKDKWGQQLQTTLKEVASDYTALQQKAEKGINVNAELNYDRNKIQWLEEQLRLIGKMDGQSILVTLDVNADPVRSALALVNKLWASTREGKIEAAQSSYEGLLRKRAVLEKELNDLNASGVNNRSSDERYTKATEGLSKLNKELEETKENYIGLVKAASDKSVASFSDGIRLTPTAGSDDESQKEAKRLEYVKKWNKAVETMRLTNGVGYDSKQFQADMDNNISVLQGEIATIDKRGDAAAKAAAKHKLSVDKLESSVDNLLSKEFALANQDPLGAAFASADEKADGLLNRVEQLALDGGISIESMTAKILQFKEVAYDVAVDKELEKLFPWLKKDNEITAIWRMLTTEWKRTEKEFAKMGISGEDGIEMLKKMAVAAQQAAKEARLLAKAAAATNFGDYYTNTLALEKTKMAPGGSTEKASTKEMADYFIASSKSMLNSRMEMYKRIGAEAKNYGVDAAKVEAYIQNKREEGDKARLESLQKVGSAQEAFYARLAENYETYKSKQTEAREDAIKFADTIKNATDSLATGIGQSFGDMIRGIGDGTFKMEDFAKKMKSRMMDTIANVVETTITDAYKGVFKDIMKSFLPAGAEDQVGQQAEVHSNSSFDSSSFNSATFTGAVFTGNDGNPYPKNGIGSDSVSGGSGNDSLGAISTGGSADVLISTTASAAAKAADNASTAIWARNNNPGNLKDIKGAWQKFETMQDGVNSMTSYVEDKVGKGFNTIDKLGDKYAEGAKVWKDNVSKMSGIAKDSLLSTNDPTQIANLIKGITGAEGSGKAVTADMITQAVEKAASGVNSYSGSGKNSKGGSSNLASSMQSIDSVVGSTAPYLKSIGDDIGDRAGESIVDNLISSADGGTSMIIGNENTMSRIFSNGIDISKLGSGNWEMNKISPEVTASTYTGASSSGYNWKQGVAGATTAASGVMQMASAQNAGQAIGGGLSAIGGIATMIPGGQLIGGIATVAGTLISAFSTETKKEIKKVASGYNVGYAGGHATSYGVDFYSDGSVQSTGASDPDVQKKISDAFKDTAEALSDFAEELNITVDILDDFSFPNMNVTTDQLDGYIRNGQNQMAFQSLLETGLRGAFDVVLEDGEIYVDEFERLATASKAVVGQFEGYGYAMQDVAQITQEQIDALREKNTEVANGTAQALATMAAAMGGSSDLVSQLASDTTIANAALEVTDEQLLAILEADYSSKLLDAVGGEDAFKSIMGNLTKNMFNTVESYAQNLDYYVVKAAKSIGKLADFGNSNVSIENFWEKFNEAVERGLTVDEFEAWGKASEWVNNIDSVNDALEDWNNAMKKVSQSLDARQLTASGNSDQATLIQAYATAEWELYDAKEANYDLAVLEKMQLTEYLELQRAEYELLKKKTQASEELVIRDMEVDDNPFSSAIEAIQNSAWEYQEALESGLYTAEGLDYLKKIQGKEIQKYYDDIAEELKGVIDGITDQVDSANKSEIWNWLKDLKKDMADAAEEAERLGATEQQLADIRQAETALISAKLKEVLDSVQESVDSDLLTEMESWLKDLSKTMNDAADDAKLLGATEQQLADIRKSEADMISKKLSTMMDDIMEELSTFDGTELTYNVSSLKKKMGESMYEAALLGATEADLTNVGTLYAYKVKAAYQTQIDEIVSQLESAADALDSFSDSLKDFLEGLWTNDDSPLTLKGRYEEAGYQWKNTVADLSSTDADTKAAAQSKIESMTSTYLELSKEYNADFAAYYVDFMNVQSILGDQYKQAKSEYEIISDQLKAIEDTEENTKTTAELLDQLKSLQKDQGDTWTKMIADLPTQIAAAMKKAEEYKAAVGSGGVGGSASAAIAAVTATFQQRDAAAQAANTKYLEDKAAQLTKDTGEKWDSYRVLAAINDAGLTPFKHYEQYGKGEGLSWSDQNAFSGDTNSSYTRFDKNGTTSEGYLEYLDPTDYIVAKVEQLKATTGQNWTIEQVAKAFADAGLTATQHYQQYGQYEGIGAGSGYSGTTTASGFNNASYIAAKTAELNSTGYQGKTWTAAETAAAISQAGLSPEQHYAQYGKYENIPGYADGGYIPGFSSSDVMLAKLRLGEFVMTPEAVNHYGVDFMEALNTRQFSGIGAFSEGGIVSSSSFSGNDDSSDGELEDQVKVLTETVATMSKDIKFLLNKLLINSNKFAIQGIKIQES